MVEIFHLIFNSYQVECFFTKYLFYFLYFMEEVCVNMPVDVLEFKKKINEYNYFTFQK